MRADTPRGRVYFVAMGKYVKIGYSSGDLNQRIAHLRARSRIIAPEDLDRTRAPRLLR